MPAARHAGILRAAGITFLFAPAHHPALRHSGPARRELAVRTIFNALGPIANPARATHQLIGAYEDRLRPILAETLGRLGSRRAWVVRGEDGLDEISPFGPTRVAELIHDDGGAPGARVIERVVSPADFGLALSAAGALAGGDARANAARILHILSGADDPASGAVALNAAAAIAVGREATDAAGLLAAGAEATEALRSGRALATLDAWRAAARAAVSAMKIGFRYRRAGNLDRILIPKRAEVARMLAGPAPPAAPEPARGPPRRPRPRPRSPRAAAPHRRDQAPLPLRRRPLPRAPPRRARPPLRARRRDR